MEVLWSLVIGVMVASGIYLMMERHVLRVLFGLIILSSAVNLSILVAGRLTVAVPPLIDASASLPPEGAANSLPQALILTAIVIGFGLLVFALLLIYRAFVETGSADVDKMRNSEQER